MISIYKLKSRFQTLLKPLMRALRNIGFTPNMITISSVLLSVIISYFFYNAFQKPNFFLMVSIGLFTRMMLNAIDGMMAEAYNMKSSLGEVLNETGDIISDILIFYPLLFLDFLNFHIAFAFIIFSVINELCGILSKIISGCRRYDGPMGKSDRAFLIGIICLVSYFSPVLYVYMNLIFSAAILLILISSFLRIKKSLI